MSSNDEAETSRCRAPHPFAGVDCEQPPGHAGAVPHRASLDGGGSVVWLGWTDEKPENRAAAVAHDVIAQEVRHEDDVLARLRQTADAAVEWAARLTDRCAVLTEDRDKLEAKLGRAQEEAAELRRQRDRAEQVAADRGRKLDRIEAAVAAYRRADDSEPVEAVIYCGSQGVASVADSRYATAVDCQLPEGHDGTHEAFVVGATRSLRW